MQPYLSVYLSLYLATFATLATIPVCLSVSVPCNLCNPCNHTCLSICLCTLQHLQPYRLSVYLSLYLATFATIPVCLSVSVSCNLCNPCNHTCLSIYLCTLQPLQPLQPYLSVYLSLYLATLATIPVCLSVSVPCNLCNPCNHTCLSICLCTLQPLQPLQPYLSVYLSLYLATFATLATIPVCLSVSVPCNQVCLSICVCPGRQQPILRYSPCLSHWLSLSPCFSISAFAAVSLSFNLINNQPTREYVPRASCSVLGTLDRKAPVFDFPNDFNSKILLQKMVAGYRQSCMAILMDYASQCDRVFCGDSKRKINVKYFLIPAYNKYLSQVCKSAGLQVCGSAGLQVCSLRLSHTANKALCRSVSPAISLVYLHVK